jgi:hypothetical protein
VNTAAHWESLHGDPPGQTVHDGPQAWLSLVASTHNSPHNVKSASQAKLQAVPKHTVLALAGGLHAAHTPPQHTPSSQAVPSEESPVTTQAAAPALHEMVPVRQAVSAGTQVVPSVHGTHAPSRQISPVPQTVPFEAFPTRLHVDDPVEQERTPVSHGLPPGSHATPDTQLTHSPSLHTWSFPHPVPTATFLTPTHAAVPDSQETVPSSQMLPPGWQVAPAPHPSPKAPPSNGIDPSGSEASPSAASETTPSERVRAASLPQAVARATRAAVPTRHSAYSSTNIAHVIAHPDVGIRAHSRQAPLPSASARQGTRPRRRIHLTPEYRRRSN